MHKKRRSLLIGAFALYTALLTIPATSFAAKKRIVFGGGPAGGT